MDKHSAEVVVKIISILGYIGAGLSILGGIIMLFGGTFVASYFTMGGAQGAAFVGALAIVMAIVMIAVGIFGIFVARGLWHHKNWARIVIIIFSVLGVISSLFSLPGGIIGLIINGAILYFLAFDKTVVSLFK